jgi:hypothetical protein
VVLGAKLFDTVDEGLDPESKLDLTVEVPGDGSVDLEPDRYQVVALGPTLTQTSGSHSDAGGLDVERLPFAEPDITVTGRLDSVGLSEFTVSEAGEYTLEVDGEGDQVTKVGIGEAKGLWEEASGWVASAVVITGGALLASLGIMLLTGWIIRKVTTNTAGPGWQMRV